MSSALRGGRCLRVTSPLADFERALLECGYVAALADRFGLDVPGDPLDKKW